MGILDSYVIPLGAKIKVLSSLGMISCIRAVKTVGYGGRSLVVTA